MASSDKFRARAIECIEAADSMADSVHKLVLLEIAQRWLDLANRDEAMGDGLRGDGLLDDSKPTGH